MTTTLYGTSTSPYVNKVRIAAQVLGLWKEIRTVGVDLSNPPSGFIAATPLRQMPVLTTRNGSAIFDSMIICLHLDACAGGGRLLPTAESDRTRDLALATLCNGLIDAGAGLRRENLRPEAQQSKAVAAGHLDRMNRAMDHLSDHAGMLSTGPDLTTITLVAALDWIALRHGSLGLTSARPALADWLAAARQSWVPPLPDGAFVLPDARN